MPEDKSGNAWARGKYRKQAEREVAKDSRKLSPATEKGMDAYSGYEASNKKIPIKEFYTRSYQYADKLADQKQDREKKSARRPSPRKR